MTTKKEKITAHFNEEDIITLEFLEYEKSFYLKILGEIVFDLLKKDNFSEIILTRELKSYITKEVDLKKYE